LKNVIIKYIFVEIEKKILKNQIKIAILPKFIKNCHILRKTFSNSHHCNKISNFSKKEKLAFLKIMAVFMYLQG